MAFCCFLILSVLALFQHVDAYGKGAPTETCFTQYPNHDNIEAQTTQSPYSLKFTPDKYQPGQEVTVEVVVPSGDFEGILTAARRVEGNTEEIVGRFTQFPADIQAKNCFGGSQNMITHKDDHGKTSLTMKWKAPSNNVGDVKFVTTFVKSFATFWHGVESLLPVDSNLTITDSKYQPIPLTSLTTPIDFDDCAKTKGCFLYPVSCSGSDCLAAATYQYRPNKKDYVFELHTSKSDYISIGFSKDKKMGEDVTITCTGKNGDHSIQEGYNPGFNNVRMLNTFSREHQVNYIDGKVQCKFVVPESFKMSDVTGNTNTFVSTTDWDLLNDWYLLLAWGPTMPNSEVIAIHKDHPTYTPSEVNLRDHKIIYGSSFGLYVKVHVCLMMVAWILFAGIVTVVARHGKGWLPDAKPCGSQAWFQVHRIFAILVFALTTAGFVIIFVNFDTVTISEKGRTHAYVGIATMAAVCLQVLAGMLRPGLDSSFRSVFNNGHWFMGHAAHILSAVAMFMAFNISYFPDELRLRGFIVLGVWVGMQVFWHIVFEIVKMRRTNAAKSDSDPMDSTPGKTSFTINDADDVKKTSGGCDACLMFLYILSLMGLCGAAIAVFMLY